MTAVCDSSYGQSATHLCLHKNQRRVNCHTSGSFAHKTMFAKDRWRDGRTHEVFKRLHPRCLCWKWVTLTDPLTPLPSQTRRSALIPPPDGERVKAALNVIKSAPSAILIIARINEGRELVSALRLRDVTN